MLAEATPPEQKFSAAAHFFRGTLRYEMSVEYIAKMPNGIHIRRACTPVHTLDTLLKQEVVHKVLNEVDSHRL